MGTHFTLALGLKSAPKTKKKASRKRSMKLFKKIHIGFVLASLIVVLSMVYLFQVNATATKGYEIQSLESRMNELKESNKRLQLEVTSLKSMQSIEQEVQKLNLVPSSVVKHISDSDYAYQE